jgi:hypothetical protein
MPLRALVLVVCLLCIAISSASLVAGPVEEWVCCSDTSQCPIGICCDPEPLGRDDCDPEQAGYCMTKCTNGNNTFASIGAGN